MLISILVEFLQKQLKHLKDNLKKCLDRRSKLAKSVAPASSLPKYNYFEVMRFLHGKTASKPAESNLCLPNDTPHASQKQNYATTITEMSGENRPGKRKNRNPETTQKVTDAELLHQLKKVDAQLEKGLRESEDCENALYCKRLVPIMKALPLKKKRLAKIKISQFLFDLEFNE